MKNSTERLNAKDHLNGLDADSVMMYFKETMRTWRKWLRLEPFHEYSKKPWDSTVLQEMY
jgi:hypothetical protein